MTDALFGLVLAGGESRRMHTDKAMLDYHGRPQLQWTYELLSSHCEQTFISVRADQHDAVRDALPRIEDIAGNVGPAGGLLAARQYADHAWLVVACDLPFLSDPVLTHLLASRDRAAMATAYRSTHDGLPEPLCAIWEPEGLAFLSSQVEAGANCPRKALIRGRTQLVDALVDEALDNINTPEEHAAAQAGLG